MAKLTNTDNLDTFFTTFQETMTMHNVPKPHWVMQLLKVVDERSVQFIQQQEGPLKYDFATVCARLKTFHQVGPALYRNQWNALTMQPEETGQQLAQRISLLWNTWSQPASTRAEVNDMVAKEKFLQTVPPATREWVRQRDPHTLA